MLAPLATPRIARGVEKFVYCVLSIVTPGERSALAADGLQPAVDSVKSLKFPEFPSTPQYVIRSSVPVSATEIPPVLYQALPGSGAAVNGGPTGPSEERLVS